MDMVDDILTTKEENERRRKLKEEGQRGYTEGTDDDEGKGNNRNADTEKVKQEAGRDRIMPSGWHQGGAINRRPVTIQHHQRELAGLCRSCSTRTHRCKSNPIDIISTPICHGEACVGR